MPSIASIVVKNAANADVTFTPVAPSSGDRNPAIWRNNAAHEVMGFRPVFKFATRNNAANTGRVIEGSIRVPVVQEIAGVDTQVALVPLSISGTLPTNVPVSAVSDAFIQFGNLLVAPLIRTSVEEMTAPT